MGSDRSEEGWKRGDASYSDALCQRERILSLVLGSKLSTAVKFKNWVTADVLPQIRKTGGYPCLLLHLDIDLG